MSPSAQLLTWNVPVGDISFGQLLQFVLPSCGLWVVSPVLSLVDTAVVGTRSSVELAALGPGVMMLDALTYMCMFLGVTVTNRASLTLGKNNREGTGKVVSDALAIGVAMGVACTVALWLSCPLILKNMAGQASAGIVGPAISYVRARCVDCIDGHCILGMRLVRTFMLISTLIDFWLNQMCRKKWVVMLMFF